MIIDTLSIRGAYRGKTLPETTIKILCDEIDRLTDICQSLEDGLILGEAETANLRGEQQTPQFQGKTVDVRVQVVVHPDGRWWAGSDFAVAKRISINNGEAQYWLTATMPVPAEMTVVARVEGE